MIFREKIPIPVIRELQSKQKKVLKIDFQTNRKVMDEIVEGKMK